MLIHTFLWCGSAAGAPGILYGFRERVGREASCGGKTPRNRVPVSRGNGGKPAQPTSGVGAATSVDITVAVEFTTDALAVGAGADAEVGAGLRRGGVGGEGREAVAHGRERGGAAADAAMSREVTEGCGDAEGRDGADQLPDPCRPLAQEVVAVLEADEICRLKFGEGGVVGEAEVL